MSDSVFTKIINRDIPAEFVYEDEVCVAIMNIRANNPGHLMVISKEPYGEWLDLPDDVLEHVTKVAQKLGRVLKSIYNPKRVELAIVGLEVNHVHLHVFPVYKIADADHSAGKDVSPQNLKEEAGKIRTALEKGINS